MVAFLSVLLTAVVAASAAHVDIHEARSETLEARAPALPTGWKVVQACAKDVGKERIFRGTTNLSLQRHVYGNDMTINKCLNKCSSQGFGYSALRYGTECWCSSQDPVALPINKNKCMQQCSGDKTSTCGGYNGSQVYMNNKVLKANKKKVQEAQPRVANKWKVAYKCVVDPTVGEVFLKGTKVFQLANNSPLKCTEKCNSLGYNLAGVEYGNECMCGKDWKGAALPKKVNEKECFMACSGDKTLSCGAGHRVQFWRGPNFKRSDESIEFDA